MGYNIYTGNTPKRSSKPRTIKQLEALSKGREALQQANLEKQYQRLLTAQRKYHPEATPIRKSVFEYRLKDVIESEAQFGRRIGVKEATTKLMRTTAIMNQSSLFKLNIKEAMSIGDKNYLRKLIASIQGTKYTETSIDWERFTYVGGAVMGLVADYGEKKIIIRVRKGRDSTEPDWIEITAE